MSEWNGDVPSGWVSVPFGELCMFAQNGCSTRRSASGVPTVVLRLADVSTDGHIADQNLREIKLSEQDRQKYALKCGDLLAYRVNGSRRIAGQVVHYSGPDGYVFCDHFIRFRTDDTALDPEFASLAFRVPAVRKLIEGRMVSSAGQNTVSQSSFAEISFPLPPLAEQRRIVAKIEALQERSRRVREALAEVGPLLEQLRQSVLAAAFRGGLTAGWRIAHPNVESATELLHHIRAKRRHRWEQAELAKYEAKGQKPPKNWQDKYEEPKTVDDSDLPELPEGWKWSNFDEVSLIDGGLTKHEAKRSKAAVFVPLVSVAAVQHGYIDSTQVSKIGLLATDGDKGKLEKNDVLIVEGNGSLEHIGRAALWDGSIDNARHQNHLIRVRPVLLDPRFCLHWLSSPRGRTNLVAEATSAAGLYNLSLGKIGRVYIPIPPLNEQMEIVKQLDAARTALRSIFALQRTIASDLDPLGQSILAKAFRGELVPQDSNDEPASILLARIREQRAQQAGDTKGKKKTTIMQRRDKMEKKSSGLSSQHRPLVEVLTTKGKPMSPEQLLTESGYDNDSIEDFYFALREEIAQGRVRENRLTESDVMLEAVKP